MGCLKMLVPVYACPHCSSFGEYGEYECLYAELCKRRVDPFDHKSELYLTCSHLKKIQLGLDSFEVCTSKLANENASEYSLPGTDNWEGAKQIEMDYEYSKCLEMRASDPMGFVDMVMYELSLKVGHRLIEELMKTPNKEALVRVNTISGERGGEIDPWDFIKLQVFTFLPKKEVKINGKAKTS
jgi:hypothetical protein